MFKSYYVVVKYLKTSIKIKPKYLSETLYFVDIIEQNQQL